MKISLNLIRKYTKLPLEDVKLVVDKIGSQLGAVEEVTELRPIYEGAVVVKVVDCVDHPDSDHLHICQVDDGGVVKDVERDSKGLVQVVCGAPNVKTGVLAVWLPPGSTVPESYGKEPFVLGARALRGVVSNGMLASSKELALGDEHGGILLLENIKPGTSLIDAAALDDTIIDIENKMFTHRPDCFGQLGVAREIAGIFGHKFNSPDWYSSEATAVFGEGLDLEVVNEIPELVPRFMAVSVADVQIGESPLWLKSYLTKIGLRPINNVVDITNYIMTLTGQPLHAYDYDKVKAVSGGKKAKLVVRHPLKKEKLELLNGKTVELTDKAILISTGEKAIGLGGVMGGAETEVDKNTKNLILECGTFNMYSIRRTSMEYGIFSDAATRYTKGQSPFQNDRIVTEATSLFAELCGSRVASQTFDVSNDLQAPESLKVSPSFINQRLGLDLSQAEMAKLLTNVEFEVDKSQSAELVVTAPFWRTDIAIAEDIVEEIGRLYGFDGLPLDLPSRSIKPSLGNPMLNLKTVIRRNLSKAGANEALTYSFVHGDLLKKVGQSPEDAYAISNALSPDLQYYRLSVLPSLLDKLHANIKAGYERFALFEIGKAHALDLLDKESGLPSETESLALAYTARDKTAPADAAYYQAKNILLYLASGLGFELSFKPLMQDKKMHVNKPFETTRSATVKLPNGDVLGVVGEFKAQVRKALKLQEHTAGFEINLDSLLQFLDKSSQKISNYKAISRFPSVSQDLCLKVPSKVTYGEVHDLAEKTLENAKNDSFEFSISPVDIYQPENDLNHKQITLRFVLTNHVKTMTDSEAASLLDQIANQAKQKLNATQV